MNIEAPRYPPTYSWLWLSLTLCVVLAVSFFLPIVPNDYWWYVRIGQDIVRSGAIPTVDALSYTQAGQTVVYHSWLSALLFWLTYNAGGLSLTFLLRGLTLALAYGLTWKLAREAGAGPILSTVLTLVAAFSGGNNWSPRPQMFAYPLVMLVLWALVRWQRGRDRLLWLLPLSTFLWVNLHGSFVLPFLLMGAALVFGKGNKKQLMIWGASALLATLLNPRGFGAWTYVITLMRDSSVQIYSSEWGPTTNLGWQMNLFFAWLLVFPVLAAFSPRRLSLLEWVWFLGFGWLALSGIRYVIWFLFLLVPLTASLLADWDYRWLDRPSKETVPPMNIALSIIFLLCGFSVMPGVRTLWWRGAAVPLSRDTPVEAVTWLKAHPDLPGPLWADLTFSSYLVYALPERPVWIDTRFEVYPPSQWAEYKSISEAESNWQALLDKYNVRLLFLFRSDQPHLIPVVQASPLWCSVYQDSMSVIFVRRGTGQACP